MTRNIDPASLRDIVAIDGPAGAGKSTIARRTAEALNYAFLDTGAMYRAATWNAMEKGLDFNDEESIARATQEADIQIEDINGAQRVTVDGVDVTRAIRTAEVTARIELLSDNSGVREHLVALQQAIGAQRPTVAEGRDMGTVVFPNARWKIYLDAGIDERARRRFEELIERGMEADLNAIRDAVIKRDESDLNRTHGPLRKADDAHIIDSTAMGPEAVLEAIVKLVQDSE